MVQQQPEELLHGGQPFATLELLGAVDHLDGVAESPASIEAGLRALRIPEVPFEVDGSDGGELGDGRRRFSGV